MFHFNSEKYEFEEITHAIQQCYLGNEQDKGKNEFGEYKVSAELGRLIIKYFYDNDMFFLPWRNCKDRIAAGTAFPLKDITSAETPCFHAFITFEEQVTGNFTRTKELHFFVSITGRFYTVIGQDNSELVVDGMHFRSTTCLIVSPVNEYAELFQQLTSIIEKEFSGYRFVPFSIYSQPLTEMNTGYLDEAPAAVFEAIFNRSVSIPKYTLGLGESFYKSEDWIKADYVDDGSYWIGVNPFEPPYHPDAGINGPETKEPL